MTESIDCDKSIISEWNGWILHNGKWRLDTEFAITWVLGHMSEQDHTFFFGKKVYPDLMDQTTREAVWQKTCELYPWIEGPDERDIRKATVRLHGPQT